MLLTFVGAVTRAGIVTRVEAVHTEHLSALLTRDLRGLVKDKVVVESEVVP
jgi:hypothetical protein